MYHHPIIIPLLTFFDTVQIREYKQQIIHQGNSEERRDHRLYNLTQASLMAQAVKHLAAMQET